MTAGSGGRLPFIVPSGTMIIHPVDQMACLLEYSKVSPKYPGQKRITGFLAAHSHMNEERIEELMLNPDGTLSKDVGTLLEGEDAVREGLIDEVGGMSHALRKLHQMIDEK